MPATNHREEPMTDIYIVSACRTPIGSFGGALKEVSAADLGAVVVRQAITRAGLEPGAVDEVILGCILAAGQGQNVARQASLGAGLPVTVPAMTINFLCGSGMRAIIDAARSIRCGDAEIVVAGGTESMSGSVYVAPGMRWGARMGPASLADSMIVDGLTDAFSGEHMGITAENVAERWDISRQAMDELALRSQQRALDAIAAGRFRDEIVPVTIKGRKGDTVVEADEYPREVTLEGLAKLRPAFKPDGRVTAGNASGINDGAAALVVASGEAVAKHGLKPLLKLVGYGYTALEPAIMGAAPIEASRAALAMAGLAVSDLDLIEGNEAFAAQALAVAKELEFDPAILNVNGGAIALGHPIGASGARIVTTLAYEMHKRQGCDHGLATACIGGGMGVATVYEKC